MDMRDFLDLQKVRERTVTVRRRSLAVVASSLAVIAATDPSPEWVILLVVVAVGAALGWLLPATPRGLEVSLTYDLLASLVAWFLLSPAAGVAFLVLLVGIIASILLPLRSATRVVIAALLVELARVPIHVTGGFGSELFHGGLDVATTDFLVGVGIRGAILLWGAGIARAIAATMGEALVSSERSEKRFRATFEQAPIGMGLLDVFGRVIQLNPMLRDLAGDTGNALTLADLLDTPDQDVAMQSARWAGTNPGRRIDIECQTREGNGESRILALSLVGVEGTAAGEEYPTVLAQARDITELRAAEQDMSRRLEIEAVIRSISEFLVEAPADDVMDAVARSLRMVGEVLDAQRVCLAHTGVTCLDVEQVICWSRSGDEGAFVERLSEIEPAQVAWLEASLRRLELVAFEDSSQVVDPIARSWLEGMEVEAFLAVPLPLADDEVGFLAVQREPSDGGWTQEDVGLMHIVGELLSHGLRRQADHRALERLVESKGEFIARVSHELRTPLTVVMGLAEELVNLDGAVDREEERGFLRLIAEQSLELSLLVEDLLVAARVDTGNLHIEPEIVHLAKEVGVVWSGSRLEEVAVDIDVDLGLAVWADPLRVRQIIRNLLTNAVRHGGTHIRVEATGGPDEVTLVVLDDGPGITDEDAERAFEPYVRVAEDRGMPDAMGLGLSVSRSLARLMGGDITYRREAGWTRFEVHLQPESTCPAT